MSGPRPPITVDGRRPGRSALRLLGRRPGLLVASLVTFSIKEVPNWMLPVITGQIIDVVARRGEVLQVVGWLLFGLILLVLNFPFTVLYVRWYMTIVRQIAVELRNTLADRPQLLSIGYHARASASVIQSKVVRDVENVELMLAQLDGHYARLHASQFGAAEG